MKTREQTFRIGRARDCDIVLADDSVSRYHAELSYIDGGKLFLTDCHSSNGTALVSGGREIRVRQTLLSPTETVRFGDLVLSVKELLEAIRLTFPAFSGTADPSGAGPGSAGSGEDPPSRQSWARGDVMRCSCGDVKTRGEPCPTCGE